MDWHVRLCVLLVLLRVCLWHGQRVSFRLLDELRERIDAALG
jgi:hypothetical protein